ncbi:MAG: FadR/GntR family transcriptional regulator [Thermodesulfobacteriota bacterium]
MKTDATIKEPADSLRAVSRTKLHEQIAAQIEGLIESGRLKGGDQLPPERQLADIFKVSRHSVREAIRTLEQRQILKSRPGSGTFVITGAESTLVEFLAESLRSRKSKLFEIFQFRRMLEPQIAALAAQNSSAAHLDEIENAREAYQAAGGHPGNLKEKDRSFHLALARATGNSVLLQIMERLTDVLDESRLEMSQSPARQQFSVKGHARIAAAVRRRDADAAHQAMNTHLDEIERVLYERSGWK